ncbi:MAG TPA: polysaccharide deacetylase family protein [Chitinophagaceae bacterium]
MIVFSTTITPRLRYITDFIGKETGETAFLLTNNIADFKSSGDNKINYSHERITANECWLCPHALLFEKEIKQQKTECFEINNNKAFFKTEGDFPFDIFAASFYLLTRYEEYLPHRKDKYGRYAHENSLAFKENFLHLPLINIWLQYFKEKLKQKFPSFTIHHSPFTILPTYDIDEGFCYKHKSWWKTWGGYCRSVMKGNFLEVKERRNVLMDIRDDPYDSFFVIKDLHKKYPCPDATIFFLVAEKNSRYDKNISPLNREWQERIRSFFEKEPEGAKISQPCLYAGLHPSWQSGDKPELIKKEKDILQYEIGVEVHCSRQHFIRFNLPQTFRQLLNAGIHSDYSMGYGSINGFRASVASSFYWYDLEREEKTNLQLYPFCYMDANSFFEQKYTPQQARDEMLQYFNIVKSVDGLMITIWHNTFLGTHRRFAGWREVYEEFLGKIYYQLPFVNNQVDQEGMDRHYFLH